MRFKSLAFVIIQFACLGLIALTGPLLARNPLWLVLEGVGVALGLWAVWTMRQGRFNVTPDVPDDGRLIVSGPYRVIRHPMYAALLLVTLALVFDAPSVLRWGVWLALLVDLVLKLTYEEQLLAARFPDYATYQRATRRLVPLVF